MRLKVTISPLTPFGSPLLGETLFGQLCWALRRLESEAALSQALEGYLENKPFMVVSDAVPSGFFPLPTLPSRFWEDKENFDLKDLKSRQWIALTNTTAPVEKWQSLGVHPKDIPSFDSQRRVEVHNTINRQTISTATGQFAPYMKEQVWYGADCLLDLYFVIDERLPPESLITLLSHVGESGFGRDASTGLGKFKFMSVEELSTQENSQCVMALASCALEAPALDPQKCFYRIKTHFGRHGDLLAVGKNPFKKPILLAQSGAVLSFVKPQTLSFVGRGIGGISTIHPQTVHQGYAPVIHLPTIRQ